MAVQSSNQAFLDNFLILSANKSPDQGSRLGPEKLSSSPTLFGITEEVL